MDTALSSWHGVYAADNLLSLHAVVPEVCTCSTYQWALDNLHRRQQSHISMYVSDHCFALQNSACAAARHDLLT